MYNTMTTYLYFDNLKFDIFDAMVSVPLYHVLRCQISTCPLTPRCKTDFYFLIILIHVLLCIKLISNYPCSIGTSVVTLNRYCFI